MNSEDTQRFLEIAVSHLQNSGPSKSGFDSNWVWRGRPETAKNLWLSEIRHYKDLIEKLKNGEDPQDLKIDRMIDV